MIEMEVDSVRVSLENSQRVVLLKEKTAKLYLPIWIGLAEADAIAVKLQGIEVHRPLVHDLLKSFIDVLGGELESIVINEIEDNTFYAKLNLRVDGHLVEVDSRPSDAIALAVRMGTPILVAESVLEQAGVLLDEQNKTPAAETEEQQQANKPISKEETDRMSAYSDFLKTLDLDDLDKRQS